MLFKKSGFTLVEMMVTLALLAFLVGAISLNISFLSSLSVRSDIEALRVVCMCAQRKAIATNSECVIALDLAGNCYMCDGQVFTLHKDTMFGVLPDIKGPPANPTVSITHPITFKQQKIVCYPDGIISAGAVYLADKSKRVQYALSSGVAQVSYLRTYRYDGTWQLRS